MAVSKLGMKINRDSYLCAQRKRDEKTARAWSFFDGRLVIDWQGE
jgi:hypothetical protein